MPLRTKGATGSTGTVQSGWPASLRGGVTTRSVSTPLLPRWYVFPSERRTSRIESTREKGASHATRALGRHQRGAIALTVKELTLFTTELATPDNVQIIVPNSDVWGQPITNYTYHPQRRLDMTFGISYGDDIGKAMEIIRRELEAEPRCLSEPEPFIGVINLGDSSVDIVTRVWVMNADYWPAKFDLTRRIKERFDEGGITIPFPVRTVYSAAE